MYGIRSVTRPTAVTYPVTLEEAKAQLGYAVADTSSDARLNLLIEAATRQWEDDTQSISVTGQAEEELPYLPGPDWRFYYRPEGVVDSIIYYDEDGSPQILDPSLYSVDYPNRRIFRAVDATWPTVQNRWDAVKITYGVGPKTGDLSGLAKQAILMQIDIMEELRGTTKEKDATIKAYENIVARYQRSSYP